MTEVSIKDAPFDLINIDKSGWKPYRFNQIAFNISERVEPKDTDLEIYVGLEHLDPESIHIKRWGKPSDVEGTKLKVYPGDVIFGKRRAYQRKAALANFEGICSAHAMVLRPNPDVIEQDLFPFFLHSDAFMHRAIDISVGSLSPTINWKTLAIQEFLLPSKEQQVKLAELLLAGDDTIEEYNALSKHVDNVKRSFLDKLQEHDNKKSLKNVLIQKKVVSNSPHKKQKYLGLEHFDSGSFWCNRHGESKNAEANCFVFEKGDLLYSKLRPYLDKAAIVDFDGVCSTELIVYNTTCDALPDYVLAILHSADFISYVNTKSFGTKMPRTSHEIIGSYKAYIPSIEEQSCILKKLNSIHSTVRSVQESIQKNKMLQSKIINQIFG